MRIFDSHAHYDDEAFENDREALLASLPDDGVCAVVNAGCSVESSKKAIELAEKFPFVYAAVGCHPENADEEFSEEAYLALAKHERCVAIGEIGLDYHYTSENKERQKEIFIRQLHMAEKLDMPVVIHERDAYADCINILKEHTPRRAVMHCFSGNSETVKEVLALRLYIGVGGTVTFKNNRKTVEMLPYVPLDRLLLETDAPYLSPEPNRGKRNNSANIKFVAQRVAEILGTDAENIFHKTSENAANFFGIDCK